jgi:adenylosuccinate synthase
MNIQTVIGSVFGDEGKGKMTDYLANKSDKPLVIRYNGGAQAGHTVQHPDNKYNHIFSHIGSGYFSGADTFLSKFFISNPILFLEEMNSLSQVDLNNESNTYISKDSLLTTPYDMMINQFVEKLRDDRHGSCGVGINETIIRNQNNEFKFTINNISENYLRKILNKIREEYVPQRMNELGFEIPDKMKEHLMNDKIIENFIVDTLAFLDLVKVKSEQDVFTNFNDYTDYIFEGAQGLLLDKEHEFFPNVTPSKTGLNNVKYFIDNMTDDINDIDVYYLIRSYMTRHGAGPFPTEEESLEFEDSTNTHNEFQQQLRFSCLDIPLIKKAIDDDLNNLDNKSKHLVISHLDQIKNRNHLKLKTETIHKGFNCINSFIEKIVEDLNFDKDNTLLSDGKTRGDIHSYYEYFRNK